MIYYVIPDEIGNSVNGTKSYHFMGNFILGVNKRGQNYFKKSMCCHVSGWASCTFRWLSQADNDMGLGTVCYDLFMHRFYVSICHQQLSTISYLSCNSNALIFRNHRCPNRVHLICSYLFLVTMTMYYWLMSCVKVI